MHTPIPQDGEQLWKHCLQIIARSCDPQTLQRWFAPIRPLGVETREDEGGSFEALVLEVPSKSFYEELLRTHETLLIRAQQEVLTPRGLEIFLAPAQVAPAPSPAKIARTQDYTSHLSADLRFETFYESACNREALRIAEATAARPGQAPLNFIFIYGPSGVGKTHLCQAIGQRAMELHPTMRVCYVSSSKFETQFIRDSLMRGTERGMFIDFYQQMDILIIDDIQGLIGKTKTQQAFFDIFNHLYLLGKQIIVTCDVPPVDLKGMEARIMTRIQSAMMLRIDRPDLELRRKILQRRVADSGVELGEECVEFIAENMQDNVRQLEGAIRTIVTHSKFSDLGAVDIDMTRRIVGGTVSIERKEVTPELVLDTVCKVFGVEKDQLRTPSRKAVLALPRQVTMYLVKKHTSASYNTIAQLLNRSDHTTIMHGCKAIEGRIHIEPALKERIALVEEELRG
ncbi:chromosomal replication initiator protein DnaA [Porphyromonas sp. oral taxon 278]|uniref:chromosomal replication initiator protein DnaA n=1 Tax=Porphyromonas sp. oral taxon 278 TaxID=712437 RepID=UPI0025D90DD3|nr:chromosomal replication initiator protein DnaA [Porphyromonas sp. oral taxon 278]